MTVLKLLLAPIFGYLFLMSVSAILDKYDLKRCDRSTYYLMIIFLIIVCFIIGNGLIEQLKSIGVPHEINSIIKNR